MDFSLAIAGDGSLWGWGSSGFGQFGEAVDDLDDRGVWQRPERVDLPAPPVAVASGPSSGRSTILLNDGTVYTMGPRWTTNEAGIGWALQSSVELRPVSGLDKAHAIAADLSNNLALHRDGTVSVWSNRLESTIGDGIDAPARAVPGLSDVMAVAAGGHFQLALKTDGTVMAWGSIHEGELGRGSTELAHSPTPAAVVGIDRVVAIAAGGYSGVGGWWGHSVALREDGTLWTWRSNLGAELGAGPGPITSTPTLVSLPPM